VVVEWGYNYITYGSYHIIKLLLFFLKSSMRNLMSKHHSWIMRGISHINYIRSSLFIDSVRNSLQLRFMNINMRSINYLSGYRLGV